MRNKPGNESDGTNTEAVEVVDATGQPPMTGGAPGQPEQSTDIPLVAQNIITGTAVTSRDEANVPLPQRYRVVNGGNIMYAGSRVHLKAGKLLDERSYDLAKLRSQGIRLEPVQE